MAKRIGLKQLEQKVYEVLTELDLKMAACVGMVESSFDAIIYGESGNGKSNFTAMFLKELIKAAKCKCEYIAYEEGHAMTIQETFINRHKMLEELGNVIQICDHYTYKELQERMRRRQSAKIWIIDSVQAARFTEEQCASLKREFVGGRKKKIIIYVSWADGKKPKGAAAISVEYYANIKLRVEGLIVFPKTRYEKNGIGNKRFVIHEEGARTYWGDEYNKVVKGYSKKTKAKSTPKKQKDEAGNTDNSSNKIDNNLPDSIVPDSDANSSENK